MSWNGSGTFNRMHYWQKDAEKGMKIRADRMDEEFENYRQGIENCLTKTGENAPVRDLPMANQRHTQVGEASARHHYARADQVQDSAMNWGGTSNGDGQYYQIMLHPALSGYVPGLSVRFIVHQDNVGPVQIKINGLGNVKILKDGMKELEAGDLKRDHIVTIIYDGIQFQMVHHRLVVQHLTPVQPEFPKEHKLPVGAIMAYAGSTAPDGWLLCQGTRLNAYANQAYQALFNVIGLSYGGTSNADFALPDLRGRTPIGLDFGQTVSWATQLGAKAGSQTHTLTESEIPAHQHGLGAAKGHKGGSSTAITELVQWGDGRTSAAGGGLAHNNMQPSLVVNYIIKI